MSTLLGRYRVVYRLVNTVYVMAVASAAANVFSLMKLVDAMTWAATVASRGVEVTPEKLSRRYPEVCIASSFAPLLPLPACKFSQPSRDFVSLQRSTACSEQ